MNSEIKKKITLHILRGIFFACSVGLALYISESLNATREYETNPFSFMVVGALFSSAVILVEIFFSRSSISTISSIVFGLLIGFIASYLFIGIISLMVEDLSAEKALISSLKIVSTLIFCYFGISILLQTQDDFRFIIPYVEFSKEVRGPQPLILDTSVIIDGRIGEICLLEIFDNRLVIPHFVVEELQSIADSSDKNKREHGRRGLKILNTLKEMKSIQLEFSHRDFPGVEEVDQKLIKLTENLQGKILTNDYNLSQVASLYNIKSLNINDLANALRTQVLPGDEIGLKLIRSGESAKQAVGYLSDGTLVVVDDGEHLIGQEVTVAVRNIHQTTAGKMVFGTLKKTEGPASPRCTGNGD